MLSFKYFIFILIMLQIYQALALDGKEVNISNYDKSCLNLLEEYAEQTSNFTKCFIQHARPITVCQKCAKQYVNVFLSYDNIMKLKGDVPGELCKAELVNVDRLEVIVGSFHYVTQQWEKAMCSRCFQNGTISLNMKTKEILSHHENTTTCIKKMNETSHSNQQICANCSAYYFKLNDFYDSEGSYNAFCMDIIDAMNSSRVLWSVTLGCCIDRNEPETTFLISVIFICFLPVLFYIFVWLKSRTSIPEIMYQERRTRRFQQNSINN